MTVPRSYPPNLRSIAISATAITVSWEELSLFDRNGIITSYHVSYNSTQWNDTGILRVDGLNTSVTLDNLIPSTMYNISIIAATMVGMGIASPFVSSTTNQSG